MSSKLNLPEQRGRADIGQGPRIGAALDEALKELKRCPICKKGFSNGKALGGHMRMHKSSNNQAIVVFSSREFSNSTGNSLISFSFNSLQDSPLSLLPTTCNNNGGSVETSKNHSLGAESIGHVCPVCHKKFPSKKSVHGHMRCHPDRQWRGIQRPFACPANVNDSSDTRVSTLEVEPDLNHGSPFDLLRGLKSWSVTGKRGRKGVSVSAEEEAPGSSSAGIPYQVDEDVVHGACGLMFLAYEREWDLPEFVKRAMKKQRIQGYDDDYDDEFRKIKSRAEENGEVARREKSAGIDGEGNSFGEDNKWSWDEEIGQARGGTNTGNQTLVVDEDTNEKSSSRLSDLGANPETSTLETHCCPSTNEKYKKRGRKKKRKNEKEMMNMKKTKRVMKKRKRLIRDVEGEFEGYKGNSQQGSVDESSMDHQHQCKVCGKCFLSGKALGGHQRMHWAGPPAARAAFIDSNQVPMEFLVAGRAAALQQE